MKSIEAVEKEIIKEFEKFPDIDSKYAFLFKVGDNLPTMDPSLKNEKNFVKDCQSQLWLFLEVDDGKLHLQVDSDSMVMRGIGALLVRLVEGRQLDEVKDLDLDFLDKLNIWKLASNRNNGLMAMMSHLHNQVEKLSRED